MADPPLSRARWGILAMLVAFGFLGHFNRVSMAPAANAHFIGKGITEQEMGNIYLAFGIAYTVLMLPGGWVLDRAGPRWTMAGLGIGFGLLSILTGALGLAGLAVSALFWPLILVRGTAGATSVPLHPGAALTVSRWFPNRARSMANGLMTTGAVLGIAFAYPGFGLLMNEFGWPRAFMIGGATLFALGILWAVLARDHPSVAVGTGAERQRPILDGATLRELLLNRSLWLLTLSYGCVGYFQYLFFYWVGYYFETLLGWSPHESRMAAMWIFLAMAAGMAVGGVVSDFLVRQLGTRLGCSIVAIVGMSACAALGILGVYQTNPETVGVCFGGALFSLSLCEGIFWTTAPLLAPRSRGLACALVNTSGNAIGFAAPALTPMFAKYYGWETAIIIAGVVSAMGGLLWLGIRHPPAPPRPSTAEELDYANG